MKRLLDTVASMLALAVMLSGLVPGLSAQEEEKKPPAPGLGAAAPPAQPTAAETAALQQIMQMRDPAQILELVDQFLAQYPESLYRSRVYAAAANAYRLQNKFDQAIELGEQAIEISPQDGFTMILVADSLSESARPGRDDYQDRLGRAVDYAQRALAVLPEMFRAIERRPEVPEEEYTRQQNYIKAQPHATLGYVHLRRREYEEAIAELRQAVELNELRPNAADYERLGVAYMRKKDYQPAKTALERCYEIGGEGFANCKKRLAQVERLIEVERKLQERKAEQGQE
ncbi:MAG: tetratricopeptide repeat protein [Terriglobia bacterium]